MGQKIEYYESRNKKGLLIIDGQEIEVDIVVPLLKRGPDLEVAEIAIPLNRGETLGMFIDCQGNIRSSLIIATLNNQNQKINPHEEDFDLLQTINKLNDQIDNYCPLLQPLDAKIGKK